MGMGIGTYLAHDAQIKRRYRWTIQFAGIMQAGNKIPKISPIMCTIAARPNLTFEETELNFLNEKDYIPAKPTWDPISLTLIDFANGTGNGADAAIRDWVRSIYIFGNPAKSGEMSDPHGYNRQDALLVMWNGTGKAMEVWTLYNAWVQTINWGDLDYAATENATIEITLRYQNAHVDLKGGTAAAGTESANSIAGFDGDSGFVNDHII